MKILYRKASNLWKYKIIDVSLDDLLQMAQEDNGIILSLNDEKGQEDAYMSKGWSSRLLDNNTRDILNHIFNDKYVITQYDDWVE